MRPSIIARMLASFSLFHALRKASAKFFTIFTRNIYQAFSMIFDLLYTAFIINIICYICVVVLFDNANICNLL